MQGVYNFLISIKRGMDFFRDSLFYFIKVLRPFFKKDVYFFRDTQCTYTELVDAYTLFEYMQSKGFKCYYIIEETHKSYEEIRVKYPKNLIVINKKCRISNMHITHFLKFLRLNTFFTAWGYETVCPALHHFLYVSKDLDYVFLDHGVILLKSFIFELYDSSQFNKILVSADIEKDIIKKHMHYKDSDIIKAALPRFDRLKNAPPPSCEILLFLTWRLSFAETDFTSSAYFKRLTSLLKNERLNSLLQENDVTLTLGLHHALLAKNKINNETISKNFKIIDTLKVSETIKRAAMLITDYSSVWSDFFFQNKPVLFYRLDWGDKALIQKDKEDAEFAKQWDDTLLNVTYDEDKLIDLIEKYISQNFKPEDEYLQNMNKFFYVRENVCEKIVKELSLGG